MKALLAALLLAVNFSAFAQDAFHSPEREAARDKMLQTIVEEIAEVKAAEAATLRRQLEWCAEEEDYEVVGAQVSNRAAFSVGAQRAEFARRHPECGEKGFVP